MSNKVILFFLYSCLMEECYTIAVAKADAQPVRQRLTNKGIYDTARKISQAKKNSDQLEIPVRNTSLGNIRHILHDFHFRIVSTTQPVTHEERQKKAMQLKAHLTQVIS